MTQAKDGDKVSIHYVAKLEDGTVFDSTFEIGGGCDHASAGEECDSEDCGCDHEKGPMEITIGSEEFFTEVENALIGMTPGDKKDVLVPAVSAFGEYDDEKVFTVPRTDMPDDLKPAPGDELTIWNEDEEEMEVTVMAVNEESVTFDSNHPLAGENITFEIELLEIR